MRFSYLLSVFLPLRKSVQIRIYFWSVFSCIQSEYRKIRTTNNSAFGHFPRSVAPNDRELFLDGIEDWERISNFCMLHVVYEKEHYEYYEQENFCITLFFSVKPRKTNYAITLFLIQHCYYLGIIHLVRTQNPKNELILPVIRARKMELFWENS